jgi:hypothetical protein
MKNLHIISFWFLLPTGEGWDEGALKGYLSGKSRKTGISLILSMKKSVISRILTIAALVFLAWSFEPAWASPDTCCDEEGGCCETMMAPGSCAHCFTVTVSHIETFGPQFRLHQVLPKTQVHGSLLSPNDIWRPPAA